MPFPTTYIPDFYEICKVSVLRGLAKETLIYGLSYSLGRLINFLLVTVYLTRVFSEQRAYFSIYQEIYFFIALFLGLLTLRMETGFFRFSTEDVWKDKIYPLASQMVLVACGLFILLLYVFSEPIHAFLKYPDLKNIIYLSGWIIVLDVISSLPFAKLRFKKQARRYAYLKLTGILINIVLVLLFLECIPTTSAAEKLEWVVTANLISSFLGVLLLFPEIKESLQKADWSSASKLMNYTFPLILVTLSFLFIQYGGTSLLKYFLPGDILSNLDQSSQYNAAFRLAVIMNLFITAFNYAAEPFFFHSSKRDDSKTLFAKVSLYFVISCSFIYLGTTLLIDIIALLLDKNFRAELFLVNVLLMANIFSGLYSNFSSWYKLADRNYLMAVISISGMLLMFVLNILLIPYFANSAAAYANLAAYFYITAMSYLQGQKNYPIPYPILKMSMYLLVCVLVSLGAPKLYAFMGLSFWMKPLCSMVILSAFALYVYFFEWKKRTV